MIALLAFMVARVLIKRGQFGDRPLVVDANIYVPIFYIVVTVVGLLPTMAIALWTGEWCAPPFNYPLATKKASIIALHVVPSILWMVGSATMVFSTTLSTFGFHRGLGLSGM